MKLAVGKKYKARNGREVTIVKYTHRHDYPYEGECHNNFYIYTARGFYYQSETTNNMDLIEEITEPAMSELDFTKPLQTFNGQPVTIITTEGRGKYCVIGYIGDSVIPAQWTKTGLPPANYTEDIALVQVPPPKHVRYVNIYDPQRKDSYVANKTRAEADSRGKMADRIACVRIEYIEGQLDE